MRPDTADIQQLILDQTPILDVRAPVEFQRAALCYSTNLPLLDDKQRELIGTEYAHAGQQAAIELGLKNLSEELKQSRLDAWKNFIAHHPQGYLCCFRGGLRSAISQRWLSECGIDFPKVLGGYKAIRTYLLEQFERLASQGNIVVISAPTGSGKTGLINTLSQSVDIEGLALHRGSAFGSLLVDQPAQTTWENTVASKWIRAAHRSTKPVVFESESQLIGRISLPPYLQQALRSAPVVELITPTADRIKQIREDYIDTAMTAYRVDHSEEQSLAKLESFVTASLGRIQKRLGGEKYQRLLAMVPGAINELRVGASSPTVDNIVSVLLHDYYDPLYAHKMIGRESQVVYRGSADDIIEWLSR